MPADETNFVPVLLGTEIAGYGMARAFWERYGKKSIVWGTFPLTPTAHSKFIEVHIDSELLQGGHLASVLNAHKDCYEGAVPLVVPCGDEYALALAHDLPLIEEPYVCVSSPLEVLERLSQKESFYELCKERGMGYPATCVIDTPHIPELPFEFPVALKPTDAPLYRAHPFEGQCKAFTIPSFQELAYWVQKIYASGYSSRLIIQDFIPGDDTAMRVVNGYVQQDGTLSLVSVGHILMCDPTPQAIGNYSAILSYGDDELYDDVEALLKDTGYRGFFNLDLKYDQRNGSYRAFELNPRAGRSSFFTTISGYNLSQYAVEDCLYHRKLSCTRASNEYLWLGVPKSVFMTYAPEGPGKDRAKQLISEGMWGTTLFGAHDIRPKRLFNMAKLMAHYVLDYRKYYPHEVSG